MTGLLLMHVRLTHKTLSSTTNVSTTWAWTVLANRANSPSLHDDAPRFSGHGRRHEDRRKHRHRFLEETNPRQQPRNENANRRRNTSWEETEATQPHLKSVHYEQMVRRIRETGILQTLRRFFGDGICRGFGGHGAVFTVRQGRFSGTASKIPLVCFRPDDPSQTFELLVRAIDPNSVKFTPIPPLQIPYALDIPYMRMDFRQRRDHRGKGPPIQLDVMPLAPGQCYMLDTWGSNHLRRAFGEAARSHTVRDLPEEHKSIFAQQYAYYLSTIAPLPLQSWTGFLGILKALDGTPKRFDPSPGNIMFNPGKYGTTIRPIDLANADPLKPHSALRAFRGVVLGVHFDDLVPFSHPTQKRKAAEAVVAIADNLVTASDTIGIPLFTGSPSDLKQRRRLANVADTMGITSAPAIRTLLTAATTKMAT